MLSSTGPAPASRAPVRPSGDGPASGPVPLAAGGDGAARVVPFALAAATVAGVGAARLAGAGVPRAAGVIVFAVGIAIGLPHGALDVHRLLVASQRRSPLVVTAAYLLSAAAVFLAWLRWPAPTLVALLALAGVHFAQAEYVAARSTWSDASGGARTTRVFAAACGFAPVVVPFVVWPARVRPVLDQLTGHDPMLVISAARWVIVPLGIVALAAACAAARGGRGLAVADLALLFALFAVAPPLLAFGVYFAGRHTVQQTAALIDETAERNWLSRAGAVRLLARHGVAPTLFAALGIAVVLWHYGLGLPAAVIALLLAVTVPHALASAYTELTPARAERRLSALPRG